MYLKGVAGLLLSISCAKWGNQSIFRGLKRLISGICIVVLKACADFKQF